VNQNDEVPVAAGVIRVQYLTFCVIINRELRALMLTFDASSSFGVCRWLPA